MKIRIQPALPLQCGKSTLIQIWYNLSQEWYKEKYTMREVGMGVGQLGPGTFRLGHLGPGQLGPGHLGPGPNVLLSKCFWISAR